VSGLNLSLESWFVIEILLCTRVGFAFCNVQRPSGYTSDCRLLHRARLAPAVSPGDPGHPIDKTAGPARQLAHWLLWLPIRNRPPTIFSQNRLKNVIIISFPSRLSLVQAIIYNFEYILCMSVCVSSSLCPPARAGCPRHSVPPPYLRLLIGLLPAKKEGDGRCDWSRVAVSQAARPAPPFPPALQFAPRARGGGAANRRRQRQGEEA